MTIQNYREIVEERLAAIEKASRAVIRANKLYFSPSGKQALENLKLMKAEVEADLRAHERVAAEKEQTS
jgi:hypothetical protein